MAQIQWNLLNTNAPAEVAQSFDVNRAINAAQIRKQNQLAIAAQQRAAQDEQAYRNALEAEGLDPGKLKLRKQQQSFQAGEIENAAKMHRVMQLASDRVASAPKGRALEAALLITEELGELMGAAREQIEQDKAAIIDDYATGGEDLLRNNARQLSLDINQKLQEFQMVNLGDRQVAVQMNPNAPGFNADQSMQVRMSPGQRAQVGIQQQNINIRKQELAQKKLEFLAKQKAAQAKTKATPYYTYKPTTLGLLQLDARVEGGNPTLVTDPEGVPYQVSKYDAPTKAQLKEAETTGKGVAEINLGQYETASSAPAHVEKLDNLITHLQTSDAITGVGAEVFKNIERAKTLFGADPGKVKDTELLDVMMGSEVFPMIGALGIGARGMDTPAERDFMRKVLTGEISLNKGTLLEMAKIRRRVSERAVKKWNRRVDKGELDTFFKSTDIPEQKFELPISPLARTITVTNPKTGEEEIWDLDTEERLR